MTEKKSAPIFSIFSSVCMVPILIVMRYKASPNDSSCDGKGLETDELNMVRGQCLFCNTARPMCTGVRAPHRVPGSTT